MRGRNGDVFKQVTQKARQKAQKAPSKKYNEDIGLADAGSLGPPFMDTRQIQLCNAFALQTKLRQHYLFS